MLKIVSKLNNNIRTSKISKNATGRQSFFKEKRACIHKFVLLDFFFSYTAFSAPVNLLKLPALTDLLSVFTLSSLVSSCLVITMEGSFSRCIANVRDLRLPRYDPMTPCNWSSWSGYKEDLSRRDNGYYLLIARAGLP